MASFKRNLKRSPNEERKVRCTGAIKFRAISFWRRCNYNIVVWNSLFSNVHLAFVCVICLCYKSFNYKMDTCSLTLDIEMLCTMNDDNKEKEYLKFCLKPNKARLINILRSSHVY